MTSEYFPCYICGKVRVDGISAIWCMSRHATGDAMTKKRISKCRLCGKRLPLNSEDEVKRDDIDRVWNEHYHKCTAVAAIALTGKPLHV